MPIAVPTISHSPTVSQTATTPETISPAAEKAKTIPWIPFAGPDAIDDVIANLPCKAYEIPNTNVLKVLREFEDAYLTNNQNRRKAARAQLLASLPYESDKLNENLKLALTKLQTAFPKKSPTTQNRPAKNKSAQRVHDSVHQDGRVSQPQPNTKAAFNATSRSVITILEQTTNEHAIVDYLMAALPYGLYIVSSNTKMIRGNKKILYINLESVEAANFVAKNYWTISGRPVRFQVQVSRF